MPIRQDGSAIAQMVDGVVAEQRVERLVGERRSFVGVGHAELNRVLDVAGPGSGGCSGHSRLVDVDPHDLNV